MRKCFFSSQKRKPLFLASLAVSLALHAAGLYFLFKYPFSFLSSQSSQVNNQKLETNLEIEFALSETLNRLILKENRSPETFSDHPHLEKTTQKLGIITNFAYAPEIRSHSIPLPFRLENPSYAMSENETDTALKFAIFGPKKKINFSQPLEIESQLLTALQEESEPHPAPSIQPKLEQQDQIVCIEDMAKLPLDLPNTPTQNPYDFILSQDSFSEIIASEIEMKKQKTKKQPPAKKQLKVTPHISKTTPTIKREPHPIHPYAENLEKATFGPDTLYFFYHDTLGRSAPPKLATSESFLHSPHESAFSPPKKPFQSQTLIGAHFFATITPLDLSSLAEKNNIFKATPLHEYSDHLSLPKRKMPVIASPQTSSTELAFELPEVNSLLNGPTTFSEAQWMLPKKELTLIFSLVSLPEIHLAAPPSTLKDLANQDQPTPKKEQIPELAKATKSEALADQMQKSFHQTSSSIEFAPQISLTYPLIPGQFDSPRLSLMIHPSNWQQVEQPDYMPPIETHVATTSRNPIREKVEPLRPEQSLILGLEEVETEKWLVYKPEEPERLSLSPSRSILPKQKLSKFPSALTIKWSVTPSDEVFYSNPKMRKSYEPKEESLAMAINKKPAKELSCPSLPRYLMMRFPENAPRFNLAQTPCLVTPKISKPQTLATLPKGKMTLSPNWIKKKIYLKTFHLAQATSEKPLLKPKHAPSLLERECSKPQAPSLATIERPLLHLEESELAIKQDGIDRLKQDVTTYEFLTMQMLPDLKQKQFCPKKAPFKTMRILSDLPEIDTYLAFVPHKSHVSNTKDLLTQSPLPKREVEETVSIELNLAKKIKELKKTETCSESKKLIQKHHEDTLAQGKEVSMSQPKLKTSFYEQEVRSLNERYRLTQGSLSKVSEIGSRDTVSFHNDFETVVTYVKKPDGKGYHFALKIKPNEKLCFSSPEQNFIFIIDSSGSIKKHRYNIFKDAVAKALGYLQKGDSFNILLADSKVTAMHSKPIAWNKEAVSKVRSYLQKREYRGYVANYDTFHLLSKIAKYFDPNKENIVVLLTDGHSFENIKKHKDAFKELTEKNKGLFSLFTASASHGNNITMLDLISTFNHGEFMYSPTHAAFPRKLAVLVKHIESFIVKNIRIHVTSARNDLDVQFYPNQESFPSLYADHPYTLYGSIDKLEDFDLILQGQSGDRWVNILQHVSFANAEQAGHKLKRNFALQQAYVCYDYYLKKNDPFFLAEAERILSPHDLIPATR